VPFEGGCSHAETIKEALTPVPRRHTTHSWGRGIGQEHFNLVAGHLVVALSAADVPDKTIIDITSLLGPLAEDIVSKAG